MLGRAKNTKPKEISEKINCLQCKKLKSSSHTNFYTNTHPIMSCERLPICKECILKYINEKNQNGYFSRVLIVLSLLDRPFFPSLWENTNGNWAKYIRQLSSLPQNRGLTFKDSGFNFSNFPQSTHSDSSNSEQEGVEPQSDTKFYSSKWMGDYTQSDIDYLENYYRGLAEDFKVATTNHKDYARKICKASLHMDKCFQEVLNNTSGADVKYKIARETFDTLSKSAQFSESQRGQNDAGLGCFGVTFDQVEQNKWIPKHTPLDEDSYDKMLRQFSTIKESI